MLFAGVVDEDAEAAEFFDRLRDDLLARLRLADVGLDRDRAPPFGLDDRGGFDGIGAVLEIDDRDVGALAREKRRDRAADAAVAAGDDRHLAVEAARARIARLPFRGAVEVGFAVGRRLGDRLAAAHVAAQLRRRASLALLFLRRSEEP